MRRMVSRVSIVVARVAVSTVLVLAWLMPAQATVVFSERVVEHRPYQIYYLLCDSGQTFLIKPPDRTFQIRRAHLRTIIARPFCRGQGGWLGEDRFPGLQVEERPRRDTPGIGPAGTAFDGLHNRCFHQEQRRRRGTIHLSSRSVPFYQCSRGVSQRFLGRWQ